MKKLYEEEHAQKLANAIRKKTYSEETMTVSEMSEQIDSIDLDRNLVKYIQGELDVIRFDGTAVGGGWRLSTNAPKYIILTNSTICTLSSSNVVDSTNLVAICVPDELVESYKSATNWSVFASYFKAMSEYQS
jgi:hypothetical protein